MRRSLRTVIHLLLLLPTATSLFARGGIERVSTDQGAPLHLVYCMTQTRDGFLWLGTMYGLVRFDGYTYSMFRFDPADSTTLSNDDIVSLYEDRDGDLWVGTYGGGVNRFDRSSGIFHRYRMNTTGKPDVVWAIREDGDGRILLGTENDGLLMLTPEEGLLGYGSPVSLTKNRLTGPVPSVAIDREGEVWAVIGRKLVCYTPASDSLKTVDLGKREGNSVEAVTILSGSDGVLWVGTSLHGMYRFLPESQALSHVTGSTSTESVFRTNALIQDSSGRVYAGTSKGVVVVDPQGFIVDSYRYDAGDEGSLLGDGVISLCKDQGGIVWASSYTLGLSKVHPERLPFKTFFSTTGLMSREAVRAVVPLGPSRILVSASSGLFEVTLPDEKVKEVSLPALQGHKKGMVHALCRDRNGDLWLGTGGGLLHVNAEYQLRKIYRSNPADSASLSSNLILCIIEDNRGKIWAGTPAGLNKLNPGTGEFQRYTAGQGGLRNDYILSLFEDSRKNLWIGTYGGTSVLDLERETFLHFAQDPSDPDGISSNYALAYCEDSRGTLWVGTGGGLNRFNRETGTFNHFLGRHGLPNSVVAGILDAGDGILWVSTHFGLARFDVSTNTFAGYDVTDGLSSNMFMPGTAARTSDGFMIFGGYGITAFDPAAMRVSSFSPRIQITSFELIGPDGILQHHVRSGDTVRLSYDENHFMVQFAALDFGRPSRAHYSYKLEGTDNDWVSRANTRTATYSNLSPGSYRLRIRGTNGDGVWSGQEAAVTLEISPPFWRTWWFSALMLAGIAGCLVLVHRARLENRLTRVRELARAREEAAETIRQKAARDFHDELGHRLTKIGLFAELVKKRIGASSPEASVHLAKIIESAQGLTDDTRNFLWSLDPGQDSLFDLLGYVNGFGEELFERTGITFHQAGIDEAMKEFKLTMDFRRHVALILKEAMNNALKHSGCANITLSARIQEGGLLLSLIDDGKGYTPPANGSGNGMKNMRLRAERIRGAVEIESGPGIGTRVVFASPLV